MNETDSRFELGRLQRIAEDIPSGVSTKVMKNILKVNHTEELHKSFNNVITSSVNQGLEKIWTDFKVSEKLKHLSELEKSSPKENAWRPTTGEADVKHIIADHLNKEKQELTKQIELIREETETLKSYLEKFRAKTVNQLDDISREEKAYKNKVKNT